MSKLVKARPKRVEDLPDWAKCCAAAESNLANYGDMILDLETARPFEDMQCKFCRTGKPTFVAATDQYGKWTELPLLEIDEHFLEPCTEETA